MPEEDRGLFQGRVGIGVDIEDLVGIVEDSSVVVDWRIQDIGKMRWGG